MVVESDKDESGITARMARGHASVRRYGTLAIIIFILVLALGWIAQDISQLWARPGKRRYILELAQPGRPWYVVERGLIESQIVYTAPSTKYGPDPTRFVTLDVVGSYTLDWLEKAGVHTDNRAWVIITFDASDNVKTVRTEYP